MITNEVNWIPKSKSVFSLAMHLIKKDIGVIILLNRESIIAPILDVFPQDVTLHQNDRLPVESNRSPSLSSSTTENLLQNDRSLADSDRSPEEND
ncbi:unnamed protein product [Prunus brigantina]